MCDRTSLIEASILNYLGYLQDTEYMAKIITSASYQEVAANINSLLESENEEIVGSTCLFINDLALMGYREQDVCKKFVDSYFWSAIVETLEHLLSEIKHRFYFYLSDNGLNNYSVDELEAFVEEMKLKKLSN